MLAWTVANSRLEKTERRLLEDRLQRKRDLDELRFVGGGQVSLFPDSGSCLFLSEPSSPK